MNSYITLSNLTFLKGSTLEYKKYTYTQIESK